MLNQALLQETILLFTLKEEKLNSKEKILSKMEELTRKLSSINDCTTIVFCAEDSDKDKLIEINVYEVFKYGDKKKLMTIDNVFKKDYIDKSHDGIHTSFTLASKFKELFNKSKLKKLTKKFNFYFTFHSEVRGYNLSNNKWEKFL